MISTVASDIRFGRRFVDIEEEVKHNYFRLSYDGDYADVIFLYQSIDDMLVHDVHYIKSPSYTGYSKCTGEDCPECKAGNKLLYKIFVPLYNVAEDRIQFWERSKLFGSIASRDIFDKFPNPSDFVFRITRHGELGDFNTSYEIRAVAKNTLYGPRDGYQGLLDKFNVSFPEHYSSIIRFNFPSSKTPTKTILPQEKLYTALRCKGCGAPINADTKQCDFCGMTYIW